MYIVHSCCTNIYVSRSRVMYRLLSWLYKVNPTSSQKLQTRINCLDEQTRDFLFRFGEVKKISHLPLHGGHNPYSLAWLVWILLVLLLNTPNFEIMNKTQQKLIFERVPEAQNVLLVEYGFSVFLIPKLRILCIFLIS